MKKYLSVLIIIAIIIIGVSYNIKQAKAVITLDTSTLSIQYRVFDFFASSTLQTSFATSTNATSTNMISYFDSSGRLDSGIAYIGGAKKATLYFSRASSAAGNSGSSNYRVQVTPDGTNWYDYNKLIQNVSTSTTVTSLPSITIGAGTSTTITSMDLNYDNFYGIRCVIVFTTDGSGLCRASISY